MLFVFHSSNVLLDENFTPKLGHSGLRLYSADKKSECTMMKTKVMQASLTYLPEDFVRHGQLTEKVDIFGCGVVGCLFLSSVVVFDVYRQENGYMSTFPTQLFVPAI